MANVRLCDEGTSRTRQFCAMAHLLQVTEDGPTDVGRGRTCCTLGLRIHDRKTGPNISNLLAPHLQRRRSCKVCPSKPNEIQDYDGQSCRSPSTRWQTDHGITSSEPWPETKLSGKSRSMHLRWHGLQQVHMALQEHLRSSWPRAIFQGGLINAISPVLENVQNTKATGAADQSSSRKKRRRGRTDPNHSGEKGKGKGTNKGTSVQLCDSWNNGNGVCGSLPPGQRCMSKTPRLHRCTICNSPGHPSNDCTKKDQ